MHRINIIFLGKYNYASYIYIIFVGNVIIFFIIPKSIIFKLIQTIFEINIDYFSLIFLIINVI